MTEEKILEALTDVDGRFLREARAEQKAKSHMSGRRFTMLIAAVIALMAVTVTAFASEAVAGWFRQYFGAKTGEALTPGQVEYIEENEQVIADAKEENGWTVELKSAISDGETGYVLFGVTAPEDIDLEGYYTGKYDSAYITPGNWSYNRNPQRALIVASTGWCNEELNYCWQEQGYWEADNDGIANTLDYVIETYYMKMYSNREMLAENLFTSDTVFTVTFDDFTLEYEDPDVRRAIDEKYAGMTDYMVDEEDLVGLHKSDILVEGEWKFTVPFDVQEKESVELITEPVMTEAEVSRWMGEDHLTCDISSGIEQVKLTSFVLTPFGATIEFEGNDETVSGALFAWKDYYGHDDRCIYAVMKDGSRIELYTHYVGTDLATDTPIVLSEVDHILLADGTKLPMPE